MDESIVWEDPPGLMSGSWLAILQGVMIRPGQWARIATFNKATRAADLAVSLRRGIRIANGEPRNDPEGKRVYWSNARLTPPGDWTFVSRGIRNEETGRMEKWCVYARYNGPLA